MPARPVAPRFATPSSDTAMMPKAISRKPMMPAVSSAWITARGAFLAWIGRLFRE